MTAPAFDVAVAGATGAVGEQILAILAQRHFPVRRLYPLASARSAGKTANFGGKELPVEDLSRFDFSRAQIALFSAGGGGGEEGGAQERRPRQARGGGALPP
ncbi:MAG: aspartate-semialdehyde dehydrogenase, partial [Gammaproteobacteria bacterium]